MHFQRNLIITFTLLMLLIGGVIYYLFQNINSSTDRKEWEIHSQEVLEEIKLLKKNNETQRSITRGFLETENDIFIADFDASTEDFTNSKVKLTQLVSDNKQQTELAQLIFDAFTEKIETFHAITKYVKDTSIQVGSEDLDVTPYQILDQKIDTLCNKMMGIEKKLLLSREAEFSDNVDRSKMVVLILCGLLLMTLLMTFLYSYRSYKLISKSKAKLQENHDELIKYKNIFNESLNYAKVAIFDWFDVSKSNFWMSDSLPDMLGLKEGESLSNLEDFFGNYMHPDDIPIVQQKIQHSLENGTDYFAEYRLRHVNGGYIHFRAVGSHFTISDVTRMVGIIINIDREIADQAEKNKIINRLEEFSTRFDLTLSSSKYGVWDWLDIEHKTQWWSDSFYELLGYEQGEIEPHVDNFYDLLHPEDHEKTQKSISDNLNTGKRVNVDYRLKTKNKGYQWFRAAGSHIKNEDGTIRIIGIVSDLSHEKAIMEELERSNAELENFAYVASHDLQEPLRKIQAFGDRLKFIYDKEEGDIPGEEIVEKMNSAASRMRILIQDLLNYSRVSRESRYADTVDFNIMLSELTEFLSEPIKNRNAEVIIQPDLPTLSEVNKGNMFQLFQNLISNALKFQPEGNTPRIEISSRIVRIEEAIKISPSLSMYEQYVEISIQDNGIGFKQEYIDKIFTIFQRLHGRSEYEGTGLGLAICRKICENHNGYISANSVQNEGTTFFIILPHITKDI